MARILRIDGSESRSDLVEAIGRLRAAQYAATDVDTMLSCGESIDLLLDVLANGDLGQSSAIASSTAARNAKNCCS